VSFRERINRGQTVADGGQQGDGVTGDEKQANPFQTEPSLEWL